MRHWPSVNVVRKGTRPEQQRQHLNTGVQSPASSECYGGEAERPKYGCGIIGVARKNVLDLCKDEAVTSKTRREQVDESVARAELCKMASQWSGQPLPALVRHQVIERKQRSPIQAPRRHQPPPQTVADVAAVLQCCSPKKRKAQGSKQGTGLSSMYNGGSKGQQAHGAHGNPARVVR